MFDIGDDTTHTHEGGRHYLIQVGIHMQCERSVNPYVKDYVDLA